MAPHPAPLMHTTISKGRVVALIKLHIVLPIALLMLLVACSDGSLTVDSSGADSTSSCDGSCTLNATDPDSVRLTINDVQTVLAQGVFEAQTRNTDATIAVVDRVGNILGVYRMGDRQSRFMLIATDFEDADGIIDSTNDQQFGISAGLESIKLPGGVGQLRDFNLDHLAAVSKAITGAYLSSEGMAFTSRTANQIVQDHFNPGEDFQPGGPLFGVQFSQLACGDFTRALTPQQLIQISQTNDTLPGPHPAPLGLAADAGGLPLYKNGALVGGVGVMADSVYGVDKFIADVDSDLDELIAVASTFGYGAPIDRRDRVTVEGKVFRYSDADFGDLISNPAAAPAFSTFAGDPNVGSLVAVRNFSTGALREGTVFGTPESGIRADQENLFPGRDAFVIVDQNNQNRYPPIGGFEPVSLLGTQPLSQAEVTAILSEAMGVANSARAQIRRPLGTPARVTISVVDTLGNNLGMVRGRDAPTFGADVSLQKARTAAFFSSPSAAAYLTNPPVMASSTDTEFSDDLATRQGDFPDYLYLQPEIVEGLPKLVTGSILDYLDQLSAFLGTEANPNPPILDGSFAFSDRAGGNLSRPFYPDGINGTNAGPLSKPLGEWSVFSTGLQLDLVINAVLTGVVAAAANTNNGIEADLTSISPQPATNNVTPPADNTLDGINGCVGKGFEVLGRPPVREIQEMIITDTGEQITAPRIANGIQIFPGSVPIYRGNVLVGAIGVSGDGIDQDDMISFLGVHRAGLSLNGSINNAPSEIRSDQLSPQGVRLRYVQCPQTPFIGSTEQNVCQGL